MDSISTSQIVSLAAQHQVSHGKRIFMLRLEVARLRLPSPIPSTSFDESSGPSSTSVSGLQTKPLPSFESSPAPLLRSPPAMAPRAHGFTAATVRNCSGGQLGDGGRFHGGLQALAWLHAHCGADGKGYGITAYGKCWSAAWPIESRVAKATALAGVSSSSARV